MKYYRVKPEYDNKTAFGFGRRGGTKMVGFYIGNELYTATELKRRGDFGYMRYMDAVTIPKNKTFVCFGARFEMKDDFIKA